MKPKRKGTGEERRRKPVSLAAEKTEAYRLLEIKAATETNTQK